MKLDPGAAAAIRRTQAANIPPWRSMPPEVGREIYRQRGLLFEGARTPVGTTRDTTIPSETGAIGVRVYGPVEGRPRPLFIYVHGGGWTFADIDSRDETCRRISRSTDCLVVSVAYRLAPEHPYPAPLDDVVAAIGWVARHRDEIGATSTRLAVGGDSAGGNLTAAACLRLREEGGPKVALQVLLYPALQAFFDTLSYHENGDCYLLTRADTIWFWGNYLSRDDDARDAFACFDGRRRVSPGTASGTFHHLVATLGLAVPEGVAPPRLHDLRHSFAVGCLLRWYREGLEPSTRLHALSTFMGHVDPVSTAVYLTVTPGP